ncbi:ATP-dependent RNA helicase [Actinidia chinensis var. chinensis]|uniref:ATP-dependent RNA helicase n=1 Tax=Actinidia chinensis var. chinensis TaxID=1590841 RepID=A0A2R6S232_ACTCC|nr:ATP-dependent RNA helicase [Actinidia chinensis var. chinensis]
MTAGGVSVGGCRWGGEREGEGFCLDEDGVLQSVKAGGVSVGGSVGEEERGDAVGRREREGEGFCLDESAINPNLSLRYRRFRQNPAISDSDSDIIFSDSESKQNLDSDEASTRCIVPCPTPTSHVLTLAWLDEAHQSLPDSDKASTRLIGACPRNNKPGPLSLLISRTSLSSGLVKTQQNPDRPSSSPNNTCLTPMKSSTPCSITRPVNTRSLTSSSSTIEGSLWAYDLPALSQSSVIKSLFDCCVVG